MSSALTVEAVDFDQLVARAEVIVIGTVRDTRSALGADGQTIYTWADLVDLDVLKGDVPEAVYRLRVPGGVLGDAAQIYPGMPVLKRGERYVLFVRGHLQQFIPFVGAFQGVYSIRRVDGEERVLRYDRLSSETAFAAGAMLNSAPTLDEFVQQIRGQLINKPTMSDAP
ncbi:MAG: hypothetical protein LBV36_03085 [Chromatiales bacterium]|nr:hypothetical protein [Chromatiales bacterium]